MKILFTIILTISALFVKAQKADALKIVATDTLIYTTVEREPEFPGGMAKFYTYLAKNLHFKNLDSDKNIITKIFISFIVEKDESLSNIKVLFKGFDSKLSEEGVNSPFYNEAVSILKASPKWKPAIQNGYRVRYRYNIPVNIDLAVEGK